jgi:Icc-related predicted phosphoesterase
MNCVFVSDLHGSLHRYRCLFQVIAEERPQAVFLGGDLLPSGIAVSACETAGYQDFVTEYLTPEFTKLRDRLADAYPHIFLILGNDDARTEENTIRRGADRGLWKYVHNRKETFDSYQVYGYAYVPPTPFLLKDWERYDVSRYVDPGCVSPEEGIRSVPVAEHTKKYATIQDDLAQLVAGQNLRRAVMLFHTPPYQTKLDRAALDGKMIDHVPLDVHVGSIALRRFIEQHQPLITLHGHVHESAQLTGSWQDVLGRTYAFTGAHDGPELALIRFDPENPAAATRELL